MRKSKSKFKLILLITLITIVLGIGISVFWSMFSYEKFDFNVYKARIKEYNDFNIEIEKGKPIHNAFEARVESVKLWKNRMRNDEPNSVNLFSEILWTYPIKINVYYDKKNSAWLVCNNYSKITLQGVIFNEQGTVLYSWLELM